MFSFLWSEAVAVGDYEHFRAFPLSAYKKPETSFYTKFNNGVFPFQNIWISSGLEFYRVGKLSLEKDRQNKNFE